MWALKQIEANEIQTWYKARKTKSVKGLGI
jgi:hypothetical protein